MRLDKIYTKIGDQGTTLLANGQKVSKAGLRIDAYGNVDELNSSIGILRDSLLLEKLEHENTNKIINQLLQIQHELFDIGAELASPCDDKKKNVQYKLSLSAHQRLEKEMDEYNELLPPLRNFLLPGGHRLNSYTHQSRCICRRAERSVIKLHEQEDISKAVRIYLNRLSDWLFIVSRIISKSLFVEEVLWLQKTTQEE